MTLIGIVLLVVLGLVTLALALAAIRAVVAGPGDVPSSAELAWNLRRADALAFREAELTELRNQGSIVDRLSRDPLERFGSTVGARQGGTEAFERA